MDTGEIETPTATRPGEATGGSDSLFIRNATGLVRSMSQRENMILAVLGNAPALFVATTVFFIFSGLPGGNFYIAALITLPIVVAFSGAFGLMTAAIPRSGGDYTIVTRVLTPSLGLVSSFCMVLGGFALSGAFIGRFGASVGVGPSLETIGVVAHSHTLFSWGTSVANDKGWWFAFGIFTFLIAGLAHWAGPRWIRIIMGGGFFVSTAGLLLATVIALFTSRHGFSTNFNATTRWATGSSDNYRGIMAGATKAGVSLNPAFSWSNTIACVGVFATSAIFTYFGSFVGGELRQAGTGRTWHRMAVGGFIAMVIDVVCVFILFHSWGKPFVTAAFGGGFPSQLGGIPAYFTLTSYQVGNTIFAVIMCLSFLAIFPMLIAEEFLAMTRVLFAYSFDGILPARFASVSKRTNGPTNALLLCIAIFTLCLVWGVFISTSLIQAIVYATIIQLVAMMLVGLSAIVFPYRRRALYRASGETRTIAGIPLFVIFGAGCLIGGALIVYAFFHFKYFGLADKGTFFLWFGGTAAAALIYYMAVRLLRQRQGTDLSLVYAEIPPE